MSVDVPHFNYPFILGSDGANVVEQDTIDDIANCVVAILSTHVGWRDEVPAFGVPDYAMRKQPIGADDIQARVSEQETRALVIVSERVDRADKLIDRINVGIDISMKGGA